MLQITQTSHEHVTDLNVAPFFQYIFVTATSKWAEGTFHQIKFSWKRKKRVCIFENLFESQPHPPPPKPKVYSQNTSKY